MFAGPTAHGVPGALSGCLIGDVSPLRERQFDKARPAQVVILVNDLFCRDWKEKAAQPKQPERAFEAYTKPSRKHLH